MDPQKIRVRRISNGIDLVIVLMELTFVLLLFVLLMTLTKTCWRPLQNTRSVKASHSVFMEILKKAPNPTAFEEYQRVKTVIMIYADDYGLPQPAAPRGGMKTHLFTYQLHIQKSMFMKYTKNASQDKFFGQPSFYGLWKKLSPHIKISMPKDDACFKC